MSFIEYFCYIVSFDGNITWVMKKTALSPRCYQRKNMITYLIYTIMIWDFIKQS